MGDSPLADNVAAELEAVKTPGTSTGGCLAHLATTLDQDLLPDKAVFTDHQPGAGLCEQRPAKIKALLLLVVKLVQS